MGGEETQSRIILPVDLAFIALADAGIGKAASC